MSTYESAGPAPAQDISRKQMTIVKQLLQAVPSLHHVDELFRWLAYAIIERFDVQLIQFWTSQMSSIGQLHIQLRTLARQDPTMPEQIVTNDHIASIAQRIVSGRHGYKGQPVENIFSSYQSILLRRYGLGYCASCFTSSNVLLPPKSTTFSQGEASTPFAMATLLFTRSPLHPDPTPAIDAVLQQAIGVAVNRRLLLPLPAAARQDPTTPIPPQLESITPLTEIIPRQKRDADFLLSSNPFASSAVIANKQARHLHAAIDGQRNVAALCSATGMSIKEVYEALRILLSQNHIEFYGPDGQPIEASLLLDT